MTIILAPERSDRHKHPKIRRWKLLTNDECRALPQGSVVKCYNPNTYDVYNLKVTSIKTWKTRPDEIEVRWKFGLKTFGRMFLSKNSENLWLVKEVGNENLPNRA